MPVSDVAPPATATVPPRVKTPNPAATSASAAPLDFGPGSGCGGSSDTFPAASAVGFAWHPYPCRHDCIACESKAMVALAARADGVHNPLPTPHPAVTAPFPASTAPTGLAAPNGTCPGTAPSTAVLLCGTETGIGCWPGADLFAELASGVVPDGRSWVGAALSVSGARPCRAGQVRLQHVARPPPAASAHQPARPHRRSEQASSSGRTEQGYSPRCRLVPSFRRARRSTLPATVGG